MLENVCPLMDRSASAIAIVPLALDNLPIGALWIARCEKKDEIYSGTDLVWLECLADQVAIAIQHGLMTSKLQSLSVDDFTRYSIRLENQFQPYYLPFFNLVDALVVIERIDGP